MIDLLHTTFFGALAALGFALLFNVPPKTLALCALGGALGLLLRNTLMQSGLTIVAGSLAGALGVGLLAEFLSRRFQIPPVIFAVPGIIPMIPGSLAFEAMVKLINLANADETVSIELLLNAVTLSLTVFLVLGSLAVGIAAPTLLLFRHRREV